MLPHIYILVTMITLPLISIPVTTVRLPSGSAHAEISDSTDELPSNNKQMVLLVTYARSGSSFTSALINAHPDVFFFFEPLHTLQQMTIKQMKRQHQHYRKWR